MFAFLHECNWCDRSEERVFRDNWTGMELCCECVSRVAYYITNSPGDEGDNLPVELMARAGDLRPWYAEDDEEEMVELG